jgi:DNA-directed RNA polymerase subunit RPC12/RpoP
MHGTVYILENPKAQRVKIGMTINDAAERLKSVNDMWLERKATCQICGGRRLINEKGLIPKHVISGIGCPGGDALPLEKDVSLAEEYLENLKKNHSKLSGSEKGSTTRIVNNLKNRIELHRNHDQPIGMWKINTVFYTESAEEVELLSHEILADYLDTQALFGEVFSCSASKATEAIESALSKLGLLHSARKEIKKNVTSEKYGKCVICGNNLTETGSCPDCREHFEF